MGIKLRTPAPLAVAQNTAITHFRVLTPHEWVDSEMKINREEIKIIASIVTYSTDGENMEEQTMIVRLEEMPAQGIELIKQLYAWLEQEAGRQGLIGEGTPEPLERRADPPQSQGNKK